MVKQPGQMMQQHKDFELTQEQIESIADIDNVVIVTGKDVTYSEMENLEQLLRRNHRKKVV